jgi:hypothetical protein
MPKRHAEAEVSSYRTCKQIDLSECPEDSSPHHGDALQQDVQPGDGEQRSHCDNQPLSERDRDRDRKPQAHCDADPQLLGACMLTNGGVPASDGLRRHRLIVGSCLAFSLSLFFLNMIDPASLIVNEARIDQKMHVQLKPQRPQLPLSFEYLSGQQNEAPYAVSETTWDGIRYGFVDQKGKVVIPTKYPGVGCFSDGLAEVRVENTSKLAQDVQSNRSYKDRYLTGFIDKTGKMVLKPQYEFVMEFQDGVAIVSNSGSYKLIDKRGAILAESGSYIRRYGKVLTVTVTDSHIVDSNQNSERVRLAGLDGKLLNQTRYYDISPLVDPDKQFATGYSPGTADVAEKFLVKKDGQYGLIDKTGKTLLPTKFPRIHSFNRGYGAVGDEAGEVYFVDAQGKVPFKFKGRYISPYDDLIAVLNHSDEWQLLNTRGEKVAAPHIDSIVPDDYGNWFSEGLGAVQINGKCGYINASGKVIIPPQYQYAEPFHQGLAAVWVGTGWHYINRQGKIVSPLLAAASEFVNGKADVSVAGPLYLLTEAKFFTANSETLKSRLANLKTRWEPQ